MFVIIVVPSSPAFHCSAHAMAWRSDVSPGYTSPRAVALLRPHSSDSQADLLHAISPGSPVFQVVDPRVYHGRGTFGVAKNFVEQEVGKSLEVWQRPRSVGHPQHRLGCYTRGSSNRSWLEKNLEWQRSMKQVTKARGLLASSQSSRHTSHALQADVEGRDANLSSQDGTSCLYDYEGEGLPPSPFSPRSRISARGSRRHDSSSSSTARQRARSAELSMSVSASSFDATGSWADESLLTSGSRISSPSSSVTSCSLSRTQSASSFGQPRPWHMQPNALPRRYGAVKAFGSSPSRFPASQRSSFFGCPSTTRGTYDGSTAFLGSGIWSTR